MPVFVSHSQQDAKLAASLSRQLRLAGFETWDDTEIFPGDNWAAKIGEALQHSQAMVVLLTPSGISSDRDQRDIAFALSGRNYAGRLIPVVVEAERGQTVSEDDIPWILRRLQVIRLSEESQDRAVKEITQVLQVP